MAWTDYLSKERYEEAIRTGGTRLTKAVHHNLITSVDTPLQILDGTVTDDATSTTRRSLACTIPNRQALWDALDTIRAEITVTQTVRYTDGRTDLVPMGVYVLEIDDMGYGPGDTLSIGDAPDRYGGVVAKAGLAPSERASVRTNMAWQEVQRLVEGAFGTGPVPRVGATRHHRNREGRVAAVRRPRDRPGRPAEGELGAGAV